MAWINCDHCRTNVYTPDNPFVEYRQRRPSNHQEMCCTLAGHQKCFRVEKLPSIAQDGGVATPEQWQTWIESKEALDLGYLWLG